MKFLKEKKLWGGLWKYFNRGPFDRKREKIENKNTRAYAYGI